MDDSLIQARIEDLVAEEHRLLAEGEGAGLDADGHARLAELKVALDRYWDLLRQRRARAEFGLDPDGTSTRGDATVEDYLQ
jgi:hypothetical protein